MVDKAELTNSYILADLLASMEHLAKSDLIKNDEEDLYRTNLLIAFEHISQLYKNMVNSTHVTTLH